MRIFHTATRVLEVAVAVALFAGCNAGVAPVSPATSQNTSPSFAKAVPPLLAMRLTNALGLAPVIRRNDRASWVSPQAKTTGPLLYTSNQVFSEIDVYGYKTRKLVGQITSGVVYPYGECTDSAGNVWITNYIGFSLNEYARGATKPTKQLTDDYGYPIGCSVDPKTGDLAVANFEGSSEGYGGNIVIYHGAAGTGKMYTPTGTYVWPPSYDDKDNLFVEGENIATDAHELLELPKGGKSLTEISLPFTIYFPAGVNWDGKYVDVNDQAYEDTATTGVYRLTISGSTAMLVSQTGYTDSCYNNYVDVVQAVIDGNTYIGGNLYCLDAAEYRIDYWSYSGGDDPSEYINGQSNFSDTSYGQALSK
jgi:hypothetical protein